jgi:hypothetical protein
MKYVDCSLLLNYIRLLRPEISEHESAIRTISNYYGVSYEAAPPAYQLAKRLAVTKIFYRDSVQYTGWHVTGTTDEIVIVASEGSELLPILAYEPSVGSVPREDLRARAEQLIHERNVKPGCLVVILNPQLR